MIFRKLEQLVENERSLLRSNSYIRNVLKEYLQIYLLYFIYTSSNYGKALIFAGGTCLRHFFDLARLSEDIDFDYIQKIDVAQLSSELVIYFKKDLNYPDMSISIKQRGEQILLKFPALHQLGLANKNESNLLYVKMDISKNPSDHYTLQTSSKSKFGFNFVANHYDLPSLMAGKIHAIITRCHLKRKDDRESIKGRDYYDLLWFLKESIKPNIERLSEMLRQKMTIQDIDATVTKQVEKITTKYKSDFQSDLEPLIEQSDFLTGYIDNYRDEYLRMKGNSFSTSSDL